ncbi:hypothetical protein VNI00_012361 [Paramarasmius palmivorus]|uniref:FAS1 domain-containing protein n=1 Tax=Paramarasmius palmivorus TaxID=297713 RepID=A0AAW0C8L0_9AGAR
MRSLITALLFIAPAFVTAELNKFIDGLNGCGLTTFASLLPTIEETQTGKVLVDILSTSTNFSILVPTNEALSEVPSNITQDAELVAKIASYHVVYGNYYSEDDGIIAETLPDVTIARTLLDDSAFVQLENNLSQVLVWGRDTQQYREPVEILNQPAETTVQEAYLIEGYGIFPINHVLTIPAWLSVTLVNYTQGITTTLINVLNSTYVDIPDGRNKTLLEYFDAFYLHGYTFFAPSDDAFGKIASVLPTLTPGDVLAILLNHVINGTTEYSNGLVSSVAVSGQATTFISNSTGAYVVSGSVTAAIKQTNALVKNGVVHVIDTVLTDVPENGDGGGSTGGCKPPSGQFY